MSLAQQILERLQSLPPDQQKEVLHFADSLRSRLAGGPRRKLKGLWADLGVSVSEDDIAQARRELWKDFPRGDL
jgi:hypothetical protein